tara:strand:- start:238 stop:582 length:345 start_codon:yes stop_codon:yes gene_type:complete
MKPKTIYTNARKSHHLKLKDLAHILAIDPGNLSRFEAGSLQNPKALVGYHTLFNLSIQSSITQVFDGGFKYLLDRCLQLYHIILDAPITPKNTHRLNGLKDIISRLESLQKEYE